jgi:hypothetical protein
VRPAPKSAAILCPRCVRASCKWFLCLAFPPVGFSDHGEKVSLGATILWGKCRQVNGLTKRTAPASSEADLEGRTRGDPALGHRRTGKEGRDKLIAAKPSRNNLVALKWRRRKLLQHLLPHFLDGFCDVVRRFKICFAIVVDHQNELAGAAHALVPDRVGARGVAYR